MGYDLHIVRAESWLNAAESPTSLEDVEPLVRSDSELGWSSTDWIGLKRNAGEMVNISAITWLGQSAFWWDRHEIVCENPDDPPIKKLIEMAIRLTARVIGDEDETYVLRRGFWGKEKVEIFKP